MKISCEIIRDLLSLYHDNVCSNESKIIIEEHIEHCDDCKAFLSAMDDGLPDIRKNNLNEAEAVKKLSNKWKEGMRKSTLKGVLNTIAIIAVMALILYSFIDIRIVFK